MKKDSVLAGVGGGIAFGIIQSLSIGPAAGVFMGLFFGVGIGVLVHRFAGAQTVKNQIHPPDSVLLPGERVLLSKPANLVIERKDFDLDEFAFGDLLWAVGMKNKESLGGAIHLTNYRILFRTHRFNRLRGISSIFLPTIRRLDNHTVLILRKLTVTTGGAKVAFVVSEVDDVISQITAAARRIDAATLDQLQKHVETYPERCSESLQSWDALNRLNQLLNVGKRASGAAGAVINPLVAVGAILKRELLDETLADDWQQLYQAAEQHAAAQAQQRRAA